MNTDQALTALADHHGILRSYRDLSGTIRLTSPDTQRALLRANGVAVDSDAMIQEGLREISAQDTARICPVELIVQSGAPVDLELPENSTWQLRLENRTDITAEGPGTQNPPPLPAGIHDLAVQAGPIRHQVCLIAAPASAPSILDLTAQSRVWGLNAALYGVRSDRNLGLGDFEDLARLAEISAAHGAGFIGINPVHALGWSDAETISPYSPGHRGFLNPLHIAVDKVPGLEASTRAAALLADLKGRLTVPKAAEIIDYAAYRAAVAQGLEMLFGIFQTDAGTPAHQAFAGFCDSRAGEFRNFTLFETLSEIHGPDWRKWPAELRSPISAGARKVQRSHASKLTFHAWLQWLAEGQVSGAQARARQAGAPLGLYQDLAVGARRGGAETWCESDSIAQGVSIGAPPDHLSPEGQNWNLAAYAPGKLTQTRYRALRQVLRVSMRHAGILRIDHVLGMNRSFWIPDDGSPGGYIRQPFEALLAVVAIEAQHAQTAVIGEDLGLVPDGFRDAIRSRGLYSYSVLQYEKDCDGNFCPPDQLQAQSLACFGTHDTPTLRGFVDGCDIDWWQKLGWIGKTQSRAARRSRAKDVAALGSLAKAVGDNDAGLFCPVHTALARAPVAMVSVQLDDLNCVAEAQNLPGTIDEHPNWRRRNPVSLERLSDLPGLAEIGQMMAAAGRAAPAAAEETT